MAVKICAILLMILSVLYGAATVVAFSFNADARWLFLLMTAHAALGAFLLAKLGWGKK